MPKKTYVKRMIKAMNKQPTQTLLMSMIILVFILVIVQLLRRDPQVEKLDWLKNLFGLGDDTNSSSSTENDINSSSSTENDTLGSDSTANSTSIIDLIIDPVEPTIFSSTSTENSITVTWSGGRDNSATLVSYQIVYQGGWGQILRNDITVSNNPYQIQSLYPNTDYVIKIEKIYTLDGRVASMSSEEADVTTTNSLWDDFFG